MLIIYMDWLNKTHYTIARLVHNGPGIDAAYYYKSHGSRVITPTRNPGL